MKRLSLIVVVLAIVVGGQARAQGKAKKPREEPGKTNLNRNGTQWAPYLEWTLENPSHDGNPFDVIATATFVHKKSGEKHKTGMFYAGEGRWRFRFTGTRTGEWTFTTTSDDPDLHDRRGTVTIKPHPRKDLSGFVTHFGDKWGRTGADRAFVPQLVMYAGPTHFYNKPKKIDADIKSFLVEHGFSGFHVMGCCHWFDINKLRSDRIRSPNPDPRTFEAFELLITKVHRAGGMVHIWMWGDESRRWTPKRWGLNGEVDRRLQRYLAARLGPLPGWTMGYGFDLWEWVREDDLRQWHEHMHEQLGWRHLLGARAYKNRLTPIYDGLDYSSYEQHRPDLAKYLETMAARPGKPSFSEDRFRIRSSRNYAYKDYTMVMTRRGLWRSAMAGGVANIWGHLPRGRDAWYGSAPFERPEWIKTNATFFQQRFLKDMTPTSDLSDGACLRRATGTDFVFYSENAASVFMDLSQMNGKQKAVAVDTQKEYAEVDLGVLEPKKQTWKAPSRSDWAIAVGEFRRLPTAKPD